MRLDTLDQRFLSKSARARLGRNCLTLATPTTTSTSQETSSTGCDTMDENGSRWDLKSGTSGYHWWEQDLTEYPGPREEFDLQAVWVAYKSQIMVAARAWGKTFEAAAEVFQNLGAALVDPVQQDQPKQVSPRYAPPRNERTFDRMGRRLR